MQKTERILGIDPGSRLTGFGVVEFCGDKAKYIASGAIKSINGDFPSRLKQIFRGVNDIVSEFKPHVVAVESVFVHKSAGSALKLGHARSAAICATFEHDVVVFEYAPRLIKQAVVGNGGASKEQVQHMVKAMLALEGDPSADAADALAAALCHGHHKAIGEQLNHAAQVGGR